MEGFVIVVLFTVTDTAALDPTFPAASDALVWRVCVPFERDVVFKENA